MPLTTRTLAVLLLVVSLGACSSNGSDEAASTTTTEAGSASSTTTEPDAETTTTTDDTTTTTGSAETTTTQGGAGGGSEDDYNDALATGLSAEADDSELVVTPDQAECVAPLWVDIVTVDTLRAENVAPADLEDPDFSYTGLGLSVDQGTEMIDGAVACDVDLYGQFRAFLAEDLDAAQAACLDDGLSDELLRSFLAESITVEELPADLEAELDGITAGCGIEE